jgi:hypothetical protein
MKEIKYNSIERGRGERRKSEREKEIYNTK